MSEEKRLNKKKNILLCVISIIILCVLLFPLFWIFVTSLKTEQEIFRIPPTFYPHKLNLGSYAAQIETGDFNMFRAFGNSFIISIGAMLIAVVLAVPASYAIAKYKFPGRGLIYAVAIGVMLIPTVGSTSATYKLINDLGLYNNYLALILVR